MIRLDRLLGNLGYGSRREVADMIRAGRVLLDGARPASPELKVAPGPELATRLDIDGEGLDPLPGLVVMMHKPLGLTCSHDDTGPLVYDLLPRRWRARDPALSTVGRLDKDTTGLLLLTDDGPLLHRLISPKSRARKRYRATLAEPLPGDAADILAAGTLKLAGEDRPLLPAHLDVLSRLEVTITLVEGRYHQVRRMVAALGSRVVTLHRDRVGAFDLPADLAPGSYRIMAEDEIAAASAGGVLV